MRARSHQTCLQHTQTLVAEIGTEPETSLQLRQLPVRPERGQAQTHPRALADLNCQNTGTGLCTDLSGLVTDVSNRVTDSHRKVSPLRLAPHETHTAALNEKVIPIPRSLHSHLKRWLQEKNVFHGQ